MHSSGVPKASSAISAISIVLGVLMVAVPALCIFGLFSAGWSWPLGGAAVTASCLAVDLLQAGIRGTFPAVAQLYLYMS
jgi:hypothetical protein